MRTNKLMGIRDGIVPMKLTYDALTALDRYPSLSLGEGRLEDNIDLPYGLKAGRVFKLDNGKICAVRAHDKKISKVGYLIEMRGVVHFVYKPELPGELGTTPRQFEESLTRQPVAA